MSKLSRLRRYLKGEISSPKILKQEKKQEEVVLLREPFPPVYRKKQNLIPIRGGYFQGEKDGVWTYKSGENIIIEGSYQNGKREGRWIRRLEGKIVVETHYQRDYRHGLYTTWYPSGQKRSQTFYRFGKRDGKWFYWDSNGDPLSEGNYQ